MIMPKWWLAVGRPDHWKIAFEHGCIWGLKATPLQEALWRSLSEGDSVLFYATRPVGGVIGYGVVRTKFRQDKPLWPQEVKEGRVIWPNRFEFDVVYSLTQDRWKTNKVVSEKLIPRGGFQSISQEIANEIIQLLNPKVVEATKKGEVSLHEEIKAKLVEIGRLQKLISESEYDMDGGQLDVVWRRVEKGSPTYVFEVQIGGDIQHAIGKLKHAHDLWNSNIFLIVTEKDVARANELLTGTFHEIRDKIRIIEVEKINELFKYKKAYKDFETQLGIL
jgi:predicted RNA-binding protein